MISPMAREERNPSTGNGGQEDRVARCAIRRIDFDFFHILQQAIKAGAAKNSNLSFLIQLTFPW